MTNGTVLVASPSAIGSAPDASGSSVPAWPARLAANRRLTTATAWVDVMPTGLSSTTQPCTSYFGRFGLGPACAGACCSSTSNRSLLVEVARHARIVQQLVDAVGFVEALVEAEANLGREFHVDAMRELAAQEAFVAIERVEHLARVAPAERHHVDGGNPQVRRQAHLGHGDGVLLDHRIMHFAARQDLRQRVPNQLAGAQLALRRAFLWLAMMMARHGVVLQNPVYCLSVWPSFETHVRSAHMLLRMRFVDLVSPKKKLAT